MENILKGKILEIKWTPYLADTNGILTELNSLNMDLGGLKRLNIVLDINDLGWISGTAETRSTSNAFVAIPVSTSP